MNEATVSALGPPDPSSARFHLRCWGEFSLFDRLGRQALPRSRKARAIVAYLAAQGAPVGRERLAALLWSERSEDQARASLRQALGELRPYAADASGLLVIERDRVQINPTAVVVDIARLEALARADDLEAFWRALADKGHGLCGGLDGLDPEFDDWLALERRIRQDRLVALGADAAARGLERGEHELVSRLTSELLALDETNEAVTRLAMRADHAAGDRSAVRRRFSRLREAMQRELGEPPSRQTVALLGALEAGDDASGAGSEHPGAPPSGPRRSGWAPPAVVVLPFADRSDLDPCIADGLTEDLAAALSRSPWVRVIATSAAPNRRPGAEDLRQIGQDLGVRYGLKGSVLALGEQLRVNVQLIRADTGEILWIEKFERALADGPAGRELLAAKIAADIGVQAHQAEMDHALRNSGTPGAWEAAMRADAHIGSPTMQSSHEAAVREHRRAVEDAPDDAVAYSNLAAYQGYLLHNRGGDDPELAREITRNIERARELDPRNPWVLIGVALALAWLRKPSEALPLAERAVAINPSDENARYALATILVRLGRPDAAIEAFDALAEFAPNGVSTKLAWRWRSMAHLQAGRVQEALEDAERAIERQPGSESLVQSILCWAERDQDRARDGVRRLRETVAEMSCALMENLIRDFYCGSPQLDEYVATARKLWGEVDEEGRAGPCRGCTFEDDGMG